MVKHYIHFGRLLAEAASIWRTFGVQLLVQGHKQEELRIGSPTIIKKQQL